MDVTKSYSVFYSDTAHEQLWRFSQWLPVTLQLRDVSFLVEFPVFQVEFEATKQCIFCLLSHHWLTSPRHYHQAESLRLNWSHMQGCCIEWRLFPLLICAALKYVFACIIFQSLSLSVTSMSKICKDNLSTVLTVLYFLLIWNLGWNLELTVLMEKQGKVVKVSFNTQ